MTGTARHVYLTRTQPTTSISVSAGSSDVRVHGTEFEDTIRPSWKEID